jgi:CRISPR-associated protein Csm3
MKLKKLLGYRRIEGTITLLTGLHIGAGQETIEIGGNDNPILRHPITHEPYIPGSSLKGKLRTLLEYKLGFVDEKGVPYNKIEDPDNPIIRIFGTSGADKAEIGPGRLIMRDAMLTDTWAERIKQGEHLGEIKYENTINRITGTALNPRPLERVPSGVTFILDISYRVFDMEDNGKVDLENFKYVEEGLKLLELDTLGGSGSRGSGKIAIRDYKVYTESDVEQMIQQEVTV